MRSPLLHALAVRERFCARPKNSVVFVLDFSSRGAYACQTMNRRAQIARLPRVSPFAFAGPRSIPPRPLATAKPRSSTTNSRIHNSLRSPTRSNYPRINTPFPGVFRGLMAGFHPVITPLTPSYRGVFPAPASLPAAVPLRTWTLSWSVADYLSSCPRAAPSDRRGTQPKTMCHQNLRAIQLAATAGHCGALRIILNHSGALSRIMVHCGALLHIPVAFWNAKSAGGGRRFGPTPETREYHSCSAQ